MLAKLIDVYSNSKIGTVAIFERAPGLSTGDVLQVGARSWAIMEVGGANPREPEWVGVVVDLSAKSPSGAAHRATS